MADPAEDVVIFGQFGPAWREALIFAEDYADNRRGALAMLAAFAVMVSEPSGLVDPRRLDREALLRVGCGRPGVRITLAELQEQGFLRVIGEGRKAQWFLSPDLTREILAVKRDDLRQSWRVIEGGKPELV